MLPPGGNVVEILKDHGRFGKFVELVEFAGLTEELNGGEGPVTVLAPTDGAMDNLRDEYKEKMMEDSEAAALFVRHHVLRDMLCCAGIPRQMPFFDLSRRRTMAGDLVSVQRSHGGYIYADRFVLEGHLSEHFYPHRDCEQCSKQTHPRRNHVDPSPPLLAGLR